MLHDVLLKRKEPLDEFCKGLSSLSILDLVKPYFVRDEKKQLKSDDIISNLDVLDIGKSGVSFNFLAQAINDLETGLYHNFISSYTYDARVPVAWVHVFPSGLEKGKKLCVVITILQKHCRSTCKFFSNCYIIEKEAILRKHYKQKYMKYK